MVDHPGHALAAWILSVNASTAVLLIGALLIDRALGHRARASLRILLYAPLALRVLLPFSWSYSIGTMPNMATVFPLETLSASASTTKATPVSWDAILVALYVVVAAALALRAFARRRGLSRALASATDAGPSDAPYRVLRHSVLGPMVVGVVAPRIVLPAAMLEGADAKALACVLKHEVAHVRRGDPWLSLAMEVIVVACWPVVPLWIAAQRVRHLMELACDEAALDGADAAERRRYGHVLLDVAEQASTSFATAGSLHFGSKLRARIEAIALQRPWPRAVQVTLVTAAVVGFAACSSAGPNAAPLATDPARPTAAAASADQYGYEFEGDPVRKAAAASSGAPAQTTNREGRLAPEAIQSVVRQSFGAYRACYEQGLKTKADLRGTVSVSFVIASDGSVNGASDHGSTLPDPSVVQCVVRGFSGLAFPPPQGGYVTVIYPIEFSPGD
jgi:beta-lactamase regulating signal transducer with metallopeptidase domain